MHDLNQIDETFDINQSSNYFLALQSSKDGFSYFIIDKVRNKCILMRHYPCSFDKWEDYEKFVTPILDKDEFLPLSFKHVTHILSNPEFTILPDSLWPNGQGDIQTFFPGLENAGSYELHTSVHQESKSLVVHLYPKFIELLLRKKFKNIKLSHPTLPFIQKIISESGRLLRHNFYLLIHPGFIIIGVAHSGGLDFLNTFRTESVEDIIFYTLSVLERFKSTPSLAEVFVINEMEKPDSINDMLKTYIGKVRISKPPQNIVYSYVISDENLTRFANLINLFNCES